MSFALLSDFCLLTSNIQNKKKKKLKKIGPCLKIHPPFSPHLPITSGSAITAHKHLWAIKGSWSPGNAHTLEGRFTPPTNTEAYQSQEDPEGDCNIYRPLHFIL